MKTKLNVAIVGATGVVGETLLTLLHERKFPIDNLYALASEASHGRVLAYPGGRVRVENLAEFNFSSVDVAFFSAGGAVSAQYAPKAAAAGCLVIDNTSHFRYEADVPLVIPEINPEAIKQYKARGIIANPNCSTIQMLVAVKPIYDAVGIKRINVATYQAVAGTGRSAVEELAKQTADLLSAKEAQSIVYPKRIAFNVLPHIDTFQENGYTREEMKMVWETQKIFSDETIKVNPTAVRVPVFYGHSEAIHIETEQKITAKAARELLAKAPGVRVIDEHQDGAYPTPSEDATGHDEVFVGRIREDISCDSGLNLWVVADNVRKGAATNALQIAEKALSLGIFSGH